MHKENIMSKLPELSAIYPKFLGTYGDVDYCITYFEDSSSEYRLSATFTPPGRNLELVQFKNCEGYSTHTSRPNKLYRFWGLEFWPFSYRLETPKEHFNRVHKQVIADIIEFTGEMINHKKTFASMYP
jgi:hypothetical protein